ncbi:monooxygenase, partial [Pyxidicoccus sp. 3LFB2]
FCRAAEEKAWAAAAPATHWTNALLQPPPPHVVDVLLAGSQEPRVADAFATAFMVPENILSACATPDAAAAFVARNRSQAARETLPAPEAHAWHPIPEDVVSKGVEVR